jgi:hypothetical protein
MLTGLRPEYLNEAMLMLVQDGIVDVRNEPVQVGKGAKRPFDVYRRNGSKASTGTIVRSDDPSGCSVDGDHSGDQSSGHPSRGSGGCVPDDHTENRTSSDGHTERNGKPTDRPVDPHGSPAPKLFDPLADLDDQADRILDATTARPRVRKAVRK